MEKKDQLKKEELKYLIQKHKDNTLTETELQRLKEFIHTQEFDSVFDQATEELFLEHGDSTVDVDSKQLYNNISREIHPRKKQPYRLRNWLYISTASVAAAILLFFYLNPSILSKSTEEAALAKQEKMAILPGGAKAKLVLEDGKIVDLANLSADTTLQLAGYKIYKNAKGELTYTLTDTKIASAGLYNTIVTPKGGEYNLQLPDGSKIFVNASSTIRYPLQFDREKREVELDGEAYFEVKQMVQNNNSIPFIVKTREQTLKVLGTSFNINSYSDRIETTLVEGKVQLSYPNKKGGLLTPNQQSRYHSSQGSFDIKDVDPFYTIAWKDGNFAFENTSLSTVMKDLERWYDVEIEYRGNFSKIRFSGTISKYESIDKVLRAIELTGSVKFKIEERRIIVMS
ncbi:FecR family protein [Sphingobacterium hotanense]|uniref:FecR family protein n=1 Tax=Sphingobacterium hotanense TaxID=649196 RepID=UPI0021A40ADB|nr:FecR family protein [Sphingobacterium hotanense]MCT1524515.1 DUF4974 domain-containing protein [Sphingobacterium hotanense]